MRIFLDNCVVRGLRQHLPGHEVVHSTELGFQNLKNGVLLTAVEEAGFDVMLTVDRNMEFQQNLRGRRLCVITIQGPRATLRHFVLNLERITESLQEVAPGRFILVRY